MIDLHTHTLFSDGVLLVSELVRRAENIGYEAIAVTDHADMSNIDFISPRIARACRILNKRWKIKAIPGVEITHVPIEEIPGLVRFARKNGALIVVGHGETVTEPVLQGTNREFIRAGVDILAHPGRISREDARLAGERGVYLEITARRGHSRTNTHVLRMARKYGAMLVLNTDTHSPDDFLTDRMRDHLLRSLGMSESERRKTIANSVKIINAL
ncbi:MAG: histidinol phosphate phosphatase domain-containing protein [Candidatus Omnitrophota bacterium]